VQACSGKFLSGSPLAWNLYTQQVSNCLKAAEAEFPAANRDEWQRLTPRSLS
jgi:hypothetical protein